MVTLSRLERGREAMAQLYPGLAFQETTHMATPIWIWRGPIQPIKPTKHLHEVLDDLFHDREVFVVGEEVRHLNSCSAQHCHHDWMDGVTDPFVRFEIEIRYDGGPAVPRCRVLSPSIPDDKRRHTWADGSICAFLASDRSWNWQTETVADLVPDFLIWLVKWMVFEQAGHWIGSQHESTPAYHLRIVGRNWQCWCGSGKKYKKCHMQQDEMQAHREATGLPLYFPYRQSPEEERK